MNPMEDRAIDRLQWEVMNTLKGCKLPPNYVLNVLLSIAFSIADEETEEPVRELQKRIEEIQYYRGQEENSDE